MNLYDNIRAVLLYRVEQMSNKEPDLLLCPKCGSDDLTCVTDQKLSGKGFSGAKGCCGYIILGPIGILCGACGKGQKLETSQAFICKTCGNKFKPKNAFQKMLMPGSWKKRQAEFQAAARKRRMEKMGSKENTVDNEKTDKY